ncbi:hypothetical protein MNB_SV-13-1096 [hydrothermal vent metagenome]|uniref:Methyl-accepting chemotaxis protein n=1 Tax=hydrothermal vent metagenome TaxID=652676 RepID=A0A1W1D117_9ZZZZ
MYKNRDVSSKELESTINKFLENTDNQKQELKMNSSTLQLWNKFYAEVQKFREEQKVNTAYSSIITQKVVNKIYNINIELILEFNRLIETKQNHYYNTIDVYKKIQYALFVIFILLIIYLFTQIQNIILFIQKFSNTSKKIIKNSTIQGLESITEVEQKELKEVTKNYNFLVKKIANSINYSTQSIEQTTKALESVERNIEDFMELLSTMQESQSDELFQKEDAIIDSLETLMNLKDTLVDLKIDLDRLVMK